MAKSPPSALRQQAAGAAGAQRMTLQQARTRTKRMPWEPRGWKDLGWHLRRAGELAEARDALLKATDLAPDDAEAWVLLGQTEASSGDDKAAQKHFQHALTLKADAVEAHQGMADLLFRSNENSVALTYVDRVLEQKPDDVPGLSRKVQLLTRLRRFEEAAILCERLIQKDPKNGHTHWNDLGNIKRDMGSLAEAEAAYSKAASLTATDPVPLSNRLTLLHYMPHLGVEDILAACKEWSARFAPPKAGKRAVPADISPGRKLRVGMYSDGFRQHPVGAMTTPALEHLVKLGIEIFAYTTSTVVDSVTRRLMAVAKQWISIATMTAEQLAQRVRDDNIDILIDLSGHNAGNRIRAMTLQPAPVQIKWVGGLINTTGVEAIDYLLTDSVESPPGSDCFYTEKLIRMPDDYICYMPPHRVPDVGPLPALKHGYVTFGCFNNPTKINEVLLAQWARLLHAVPGSRLFLKGGSYESQEVRNRIHAILMSHGIDSERVRLEGQSPHFELFERYNEVDVALDPWPYSGGLTTCEAMLMGVPVVTLPGPTFAGRHSATHLTNAGMPELVAADWDQYLARATELASDLESLSIVRLHLRKALLDSPVCNGQRFARNLANALRAVWQRYCEGKAPAALSFTPEGVPQFEGDDAPMTLVHPEDHTERAENDTSFRFSFKGQIVILDHGGALIGDPSFRSLYEHGALQTISIDPAGLIKDADRLRQRGELQHYHTHLALGDGAAATMYASLDARLSGTLEPLPMAEQLPFLRQDATVLAKLPIPTTALDDIQGLDRIDWLILNETHDNLKILQGAERLLSTLLIVHARVMFVNVFKKQTDLAGLSNLLAKHGFRLLRLENQRMCSLFSNIDLKQAHKVHSQLLSCDAIFVPDDERIAALDDNQRRKLAFILHAVYRSPDLVHRVLQATDKQVAEDYLAAQFPTQPSLATFSTGESASKVIAAPALVNAKGVEHRTCVGVPVYNEEKYLEETILSLKKQNVDSVKYLVSDNASTDRTAEILRDLTAADERFEIVRQETNIGSVKNWKFLFEESNSEYFMWLGGHDYLSDNYLTRVISLLDKKPSVAMACGMPFGIMEGRAAGLVSQAIYDFSDPSPLKRYVKSVAELANCTVLQSLFRRKQLDGFEIKPLLSWDHVFISHLLWHGRLEFVPDARYIRRYFETRGQTYDQRVTGQNAALSRADFFDYYAENFQKNAKPTLSRSEFDSHAREVQRILHKRFMPKQQSAPTGTSSKAAQRRRS